MPVEQELAQVREENKRLREEHEGLKGLLLAMMEFMRDHIGRTPPGYHALRANLGNPSREIVMKHAASMDRERLKPASGETLPPF